MIYVDEIVDYADLMPSKRALFARTGSKWCHMRADTLDELHAMAEAIGMKRSWFQDKPGFPHYDLVPKRRALAVKRGAKEISAREWPRLFPIGPISPKTEATC
ncbi:MAG: DUF4031 domain-containing protein [Fimbriimonadaceae bacterium]